MYVEMRFKNMKQYAKKLNTISLTFKGIMEIQVQ